MCVPVVIGRGGSVDQIVNRADFGGVLLFSRLQCYSKGMLIPGIPTEAIYLVVSVIECRVEVSGIQVVIRCRHAESHVPTLSCAAIAVCDRDLHEMVCP